MPTALAETAGSGMTMATVLSSITEVFTAAIGWVGTIAGTIASEPLLLIGVVITFVGVGIGLFSRLLHV